MLKPSHRLRHQPRVLMQIPVGVAELGVPEVRGERRQPAFGISAGVVAAAQDLDGHGVPQVMQARPRGVRLAAQTEPLGQPSERPIQGRRDNPAAGSGYEEGLGDYAAQEGIASFAVGLQLGEGRRVDGDQPGFTELRIADGDDAQIEIDILDIEIQGFADPHPSDSKQAVDRVPPKAVERRCSGPLMPAFRQDAPDLVFAEDMRAEGAPLPRQQVRGGDLGAGIAEDSVTGEAAHRTQPSGQVIRVAQRRLLGPLHRQLRRDVRRMAPLHEVGKIPKVNLVLLQPEAEGAAQLQILGHAGEQAGHAASPGQGRATARRPSRSTFAYRRVVSGLRCRSTWPISVSDSPLLSMSTASAWRS